MKGRDLSQPGERLVLIFLICVISVAIITGVAAWQSRRPSEGRPYEKLTVEEAMIYMSYEKEYRIVDVRSEELYGKGHLRDALSLPYDNIVAKGYDLLPDINETVYVYGSSEDESCAAAQKLSDMGFTSISEIGTYEEWKTVGAETEGMP